MVLLCILFLVFFFFKQKTAYEMRISDWSSDVCSSDLNEVLCRLESAAIAANDLGHDLSSVVPDLSKLPNPAACNEMESAVGQIQFMRDMQYYIDAQEGGPGKGWFRIVETPAEARKVINDGKKIGRAHF